MPMVETLLEWLEKKGSKTNLVTRTFKYWLNEWYKEHPSTEWADWMDLHETFIRDEEWLEWLRKYRGEIER